MVRFRLLGVLLVALGAPATAQEIDFQRDVQPIFRDRCYSCHDSQESKGGLRLDSRWHAKQGGYSGGVILGGTLEDNELFVRITSPDEDFRMPYGERALSATEVALIRRWIEAGSPWPAGPERLTSDPIDPDEAAVGGVQEVLLRFAKERAPVLLVLCVLAFLGVRARGAVARGESLRRPLALLARTPASVYAALVLCVAVAGLVSQNARLVHELDEILIDTRTSLQENLIRSFYGHPLTPYRPDVPRGIGGTYYRGNCERSPRLFNDGAYRTCSLELSLCDSNRRPVDIGDPVPQGDLLVRVEIVRAPNTAPTMFSERRMQSAFLSEETFLAQVSELQERFAVLEVLEEGERWVGYYPLPMTGEPAVEGMVYLYVNRRTDGRRFTPVAHYGIGYDLYFEDGVLAPGSDLWMGTLFWTSALEVPRKPGLRSLDDWFNTEPLPTIPDEDPNALRRGR